MQQASIELKNFNSPQAASVALGQFVGNLLPTQSELVTEDLATFLVAHHILITGINSVAAIKQYFQSVPDIQGIVEELLVQMERSDLLSITGDEITIKQRFVDIGGNVENLKRFLPRIFKLSADRILSDAAKGNHKSKKEALRYFVIPDDQETATEAQALYVEYKAKMLNLVAKAEKSGRKGEGVRLVGVLNCALVPEDFV